MRIPYSCAIAMTAVSLLAAAPASAVDEGCITGGCHTNYLKAKVTHEALDNCADCHVLLPGRSEKLHEAKASKSSATRDYKLLKAVPDLCWECHDSVEEKTDNLHPPYEDGECLECHDSHRSQHPALLKRSVAETCYECHDEIQEKVESSRVLHDPLDSDESCVNCHESHGADPDKYLKAPTVMKLCGAECHDDLVAEIEAVPKDRRHGPIQKGECQACHDVHGSPNATLLRGAYPSSTYAAWNSMTYKGCFGKCHDLKKFAAKGETGFSNKDKNLHFVHVNRAKGRSCRMCHEPHAAADAHLLRESVPFGKWAFELQWKSTTDGASCAPACHTEKKYTGAVKPASEKK